MLYRKYFQSPCNITFFDDHLHFLGPVSLTPEQLGKLSSELDIVQQNCKVFSDMLTELTPGSEDPSDLELLQVLLINLYLFWYSEFTDCFTLNLGMCYMWRRVPTFISLFYYNNYSISSY